MTARAAMLPAAPALFSTMKGGRSDSVSHCATIRGTMSEPARRDAAENGGCRRERCIPQGGGAGRCGDNDRLSAARHNFLRDVAPAARLVRMVNLVVAHPSIPASTLAEFIAPVIAKSGIKGSL